MQADESVEMQKMCHQLLSKEIEKVQDDSHAIGYS